MCVQPHVCKYVCTVAGVLVCAKLGKSGLGKTPKLEQVEEWVQQGVAELYCSTKQMGIMDGGGKP